MMKRGRLQAGLPCWILAAAFYLLTGCIQPAPAPPTAPPLKPITNRTTDPSQTGQQEASLQLTDEGRRQLASGRLDEAISIFQKAISLYPKNSYAYYYLAQARYMKRDYTQSLTPLRQAELYLSDDPVWLARIDALRGQVFEALVRIEEAKDQYEKALASDPANPDARDGLERIQNLTAPPE